MQPVIRANNLAKRYQLGVRPGLAHRNLTEGITDALKGLGRGLGRLARPWRRRQTGPADATFWALNGVSFDVRPGEVVGIVGCNGAGKSTLLKVLSRIVEPTSGRVEVRGRMASLLEVGTGFHPELTGRENVFLNGAILGMTRREIARKFDEIVAFAEIDRFLDTPVKRYSSGMYVRLAFAVAAHLEQEILLVDEVLAVGDATFQKKCMNKMEDVGHQGRTVLFVSHSMPSISRLCQRALLLEKGRVRADGPAPRVISEYLRSSVGAVAERQWPDPDKAPGNDVVRLQAVRVRTEDGQTSGAVDIRQPVGIEMEFVVRKAGHVLVPNLHFTNEQGMLAFIAADQNPDWRRRPRPEGHYVSTAWIPGNLLAEGTLIVAASISTMDPVFVHFHEPEAVAFQVVDSLDGDSARGDYAGVMPGVFRPLLQWDTQFSANGRHANPVKV
jgi:lipopolysaccharide transport system ATP-binding protein